MVSIGEGRWRILRRLLRRPRHRGPFAEIRNHVRKNRDRLDVAALVAMGLVRMHGTQYELTREGVQAADLGEVELPVYFKGLRPQPKLQKAGA